MNLVEQTAVELTDVIAAIVLKRTAFDEHAVAVIYGSEEERQAIAHALSQRTQSGKTWLELMSWSKLDEVAQKNDAAHRAHMAYRTLVDEDAFKTCDSLHCILRLAETPTFWEWCKRNHVVYVPTDNPNWWMRCLLNETTDEHLRIDHEFAVMNRAAQA